jgi:hypothetical protein
MLMFFVNSASGFSVDRLEDLLGDEIVQASGEADFGAVSRLFGGCTLIGSPMIRGDGVGYAVKPGGQPYGRRRMQQWLAEADFFVWRVIGDDGEPVTILSRQGEPSCRREGIPATMSNSWRAYLDVRMDQARNGALARTGHAAIVSSSAIHRTA